MISFLFILGVLDNLIFGSLFVSGQCSSFMNTLFTLIIRIILLFSIITTSIYCNFNMIVRIINFIRSFIHLPKLGFKVNWDLILFYYIYTSLFFFLSLIIKNPNQYIFKISNPPMFGSLCVNYIMGSYNFMYQLY